MKILSVFFLALFLAQACSSSTKNESSPQQEIADEIPEGLRLIQANDCGTCHHTKNTLLGPSYQAIAAKYSTNDSVLYLLSSKVKKGGGGVWGETPMNAHPSLAEEDIRTMLTYILALEPLQE